MGKGGARRTTLTDFVSVERVEGVHEMLRPTVSSTQFPGDSLLTCAPFSSAAVEAQ